MYLIKLQTYRPVEFHADPDGALNEAMKRSLEEYDEEPARRR